jgi:hypothetical protein
MVKTARVTATQTPTPATLRKHLEQRQEDELSRCIGCGPQPHRQPAAGYRCRYDYSSIKSRSRRRGRAAGFESGPLATDDRVSSSLGQAFSIKANAFLIRSLSRRMD